MYFSWKRNIHFDFQDTGKCTHLRIEAVSNISAIKVETPFNWLSPAPTRARIQSTMDTSADSHGTKHPICAMRTITPVWRIYVDLPPILGPIKQIVSKSKIINLFLLLINWLLVLNCTLVTHYLGRMIWHTKRRTISYPKTWTNQVTAHSTPWSNAILSSDKPHCSRHGEAP